MRLTISGDNAYLIRRKLAKQVEPFRKDYGDLAIEQIDGQIVEPDKLKEALTSLPFLAARKLVIVHDATRNKLLEDVLTSFINEPEDTTDLILVESNLDKRTSLFKLLKSKTELINYEEISQRDLPTWIATVVKERGGTIAQSDARYLADRTGANQQLVSNELDKLLLYDLNISRQSIDLLVDQTPQSTIFQLIEAAFSGHYAQAASIYGEQRRLKVEPQQIIAMLNWQLNILAIVKAAGSKSSADIAREAKLNPFVISKSVALAQKLDQADIKRLVASLLRIDIAIKTSKIDADEALQNYLLAI